MKMIFSTVEFAIIAGFIGAVIGYMIGINVSSRLDNKDNEEIKNEND